MVLVGGCAGLDELGKLAIKSEKCKGTAEPAAAGEGDAGTEGEPPDEAGEVPPANKSSKLGAAGDDFTTEGGRTAICGCPCGAAVSGAFGCTGTDSWTAPEPGGGPEGRGGRTSG